jgi:Domain of unknown function (DUF4136)
MTMRTLMTLLVMAAATTSSVEYDSRADFSRYQTWSWHERVTPAASPVADKRIREAIERGLAARGLSRVDRDPTLLVVYHASKTTEIDLAPVNNTAASTSTGIQYVEKGSLVVEMLDAASGNIVWRGHVTGVLNYGPSEVAEQVKAAVDKLLENFPPPAHRPGRP